MAAKLASRFLQTRGQQPFTSCVASALDQTLWAKRCTVGNGSSRWGVRAELLRMVTLSWKFAGIRSAGTLGPGLRTKLMRVMPFERRLRVSKVSMLKL